MSQRVALAPIRDSSLNKRSPRRSPYKAQRSHTVPFIPLTPTDSQYKHHLTAQSVAPLSATPVPLQHLHLTPNSTSASPPSFVDSSDCIDKSAAAGLAATKLRLNLQLAVYKLQKRGVINSKGKPNQRLPALKSFASSASANVNLQQVFSSSASPTSLNSAVPASKPSSRRAKPTLSATAYDKNLLLFRNSQKLKLYGIRKESRFSTTHKKHMPLVPLRGLQQSFNASHKPTISLNPPQLSFKHNSVSMASRSRSLPSINKILKTPLKASSRDFDNSYFPSTKSYKPYILNTDETIDEDDDGPIKESTCNSIRMGKDILSSSPTHGANAFGTPNSFSVAKSLLQLGSGFYN
ncbi:Uncharacterized protein ABC855_g1153 [[Candida] zeylanoides]